MKKQSKKKLSIVGTILLFVLGCSILVYPMVSDAWNKQRDKQLIATYQDKVSEITDTNYSSYLEDASAYNKTLIGFKMPDAFSIHEGVRDPAYEVLLNVTGDGIMGYIDIPSISVKLPIYHYTTDETLEKGVGHLPGSSLPVGGESTHAVLSAHRGLPSAKMFTDLNRVEVGEVFYLHVLDETLAYQVDQIQVVEPIETEALGIIEGEDHVSLVTCTPYGINSQRLLVRGTRIAYNDTDKQEEKQAQKVVVTKHNTFDYRNLICIVLGILLGGGLTMVIMKLVTRRKE